jgi:NAD(P)H-dependent glutamate synthase small subunit
MGKPTGFMEFARQDPPKRPARERIHDYHEIEELLSPEELQTQAARCMDCGIPYCHSYGCPVQNIIPDWNDMVYRGQWRKALEILHATNNFPEFTGRICPAPCETACTLSINQPPVTIRQIEKQIVERGWQEGWIAPQKASRRSKRKVAVIGSGPAGLAAAQQLARMGHEVVVYEKADRIGGLLRYGIPDFKLDKSVIDRRLEQMRAEGVVFEAGVDVGRDISAAYLRRTFDAVILAAGSRVPRDLPIPGRELAGIHFAMDYLTRSNRKVAGDDIPDAEDINAYKKKVLVIGGGDTGADCVGTARRQGAMEIHQVEILGEPPVSRDEGSPWPSWPQILRTSSSHEEGCQRSWSVMSKEFIGVDGQVKKVRCAKVNWIDDGKSCRPEEAPGTEFELEADLVLLAMGFVHPEKGPLVEDFGLKTDARGNIVTDEKLATSDPMVFAAGDCALGASLVVRCIMQGRRAAESADAILRP